MTAKNRPTKMIDRALDQTSIKWMILDGSSITPKPRNLLTESLINLENGLTRLQRSAIVQRERSE
jgi:hypothetical protein